MPSLQKNTNEDEEDMRPEISQSSSPQNQDDQKYDSTPLRFGSVQEIYERYSLVEIIPDCLEKVVKDGKWVKAMDEETKVIEKKWNMGISWEARNKEIIGVKWIFKIKLNTDGSIQKHKTKLVAKGYSQRPKVDYKETFVPVARFDTIRVLMA